MPPELRFGNTSLLASGRPSRCVLIVDHDDYLSHAEMSARLANMPP
jgi:hypothetical protein